MLREMWKKRQRICEMYTCKEQNPGIDFKCQSCPSFWTGMRAASSGTSRSGLKLQTAVCEACGRQSEGRLPLCSCGMARYCGPACQKRDWAAHKVGPVLPQKSVFLSCSK